MSKITLDHLELSREIALMIQQGNIKQAYKHYNQRKKKTEQALEFLASPETREACSDCLLQTAINVLVRLTLPENPDNEDRKAQNYLVAAYVIQQATARHKSNSLRQQTIDGELLH